MPAKIIEDFFYKKKKNIYHENLFRGLDAHSIFENF